MVEGRLNKNATTMHRMTHWTAGWAKLDSPLWLSPLGSPLPSDALDGRGLSGKCNGKERIVHRRSIPPVTDVAQRPSAGEAEWRSADLQSAVPTSHVGGRAMVRAQCRKQGAAGYKPARRSAALLFGVMPARTNNLPNWSSVCVYRSADFQSAVSPICNRQSVGSVPRAVVPRRLAECNSAIQQTTSLRYGHRRHGKQIPVPSPGSSWRAPPALRPCIGTMNRRPSRAGRKAPINRTHSRRFARFGDARRSRSVWSACVFSAAFPKQAPIRWQARFMERRMPEAEHKRQRERIAASRGHFAWLDEIFRETGLRRA
jgi:hypothetical protein